MSRKLKQWKNKFSRRKTAAKDHKDTYLHKDWRTLLVHGYVHEIQNVSGFSMNIPIEICNLVYDFFPKLRIFEIYDHDKFLVLGNGHQIKGKGNNSECGGYLIYPSCNYSTNKGYTKGIHFFSMKAHTILSCYHAIGVKSQRNKSWVHESSQKFHMGGDFTSYLERKHKYQWKDKQTMTLKLDLVNNKVTYYFESEKEPFQTDVIDKGKEYFIAFQLCQRMKNHFEIVETPDVLRQAI